MQRYFDSVQNASGDAINGASITVFNAQGGLATLYSDNGVTPLANPLTSDNTGQYSFYAANGTYSTTTTAAGLIAKTESGIVLYDPLDVGTYSAKSFGAVGDGVANDTAAIQAAINAIGPKGGTVSLGAAHKITATLDIPYSNISLAGLGADRSHDVGNQGALAGTKLIWAGSSGGTIVQFRSPEGASNQKLTGGGVRNVYFDCAGLANYAIDIVSRNSGVYENLHFNEPLIAGVHTSVATTLGEARDTQENYFRNLSARCLLNASGLAFIDGGTGANSSLNTFMQCRAVIKDGTGFIFGNTDNNNLLDCVVNRSGGGAGNAVEFRGSNVAANQVARSNAFIRLSVGGSAPIIARGTSSYTNASHDNLVMWADKENATPDPTIETGASVWYSTDRNTNYKAGSYQAVIADSTASVDAERPNLGNGSLRIRNGGNNHIRLTDGANEVAINQDGSGNLRFQRVTGTTNVQFFPPVMFAGTNGVGFYNTTPIAQPTTGIAAATFVANTGTAVQDTSTFDGYTLKQVVKALRNYGLLA